MKSVSLLVSLCFLQLISADLFEQRKSFHDELCRNKPELKTCRNEFTKNDFDKEENRQKKEVSRWHRQTRRAASWADEADDDYEYMMWRKYQRMKARRRMMR